MRFFDGKGHLNYFFLICPIFARLSMMCDLEMSNVITDKTSQEVTRPMSNLKCLCFFFLWSSQMDLHAPVLSSYCIFDEHRRGRKEEKKKNHNLVSASLWYLFKSMIAIRNILNLINLFFWGFFYLFFSCASWQGYLKRHYLEEQMNTQHDWKSNLIHSDNNEISVMWRK